MRVLSLGEHVNFGRDAGVGASMREEGWSDR